MKITEKVESEIATRVLIIVLVAVMVTLFGLSLSTRTQDVLAGTIGIVFA